MEKELIAHLHHLGDIKIVILGGLFVALTTSLGALVAVFFRKLPGWGLELSMAFGGGVMLVASFTSLIIPAIEMSSIYLVSLGIVLSFALFFLLKSVFPISM